MRRLGWIGVVFVVWTLASLARAAEVSVAVAANFAEPAEAIGAAFHRASGHTVQLSVGPTGGLYAQISHGAPYEVFLSADADRPKRAEAEGFAVPGTRLTYAVGRLVLYSRTPGLVDAKGEVLRRGRFEKLAIADPASAPYGAAALETLKQLGLEEALRPKIVKGASIGQAFEFASTGAAELGFVAQSQVANIKAGSRWIVPETLHSPILQDAVLLKPGAGDPAARAFMAFLRSPAAVTIIRRYGYEVR